MKVYEATYQGHEGQGVYALSVVENPAMKDLWIALKEHNTQLEFAEIDSEKRILLGAALIPDQLVRRAHDGQEFFITFKAETIEALAHDFIKNGMQSNSSLEHEVALSGMSVVQSWTVDDPDNDKSNAYGKKYPKGTWVAMMKVDNDEIWNKVKLGEIKGFSIDAFIGLEQIKLKSDMSKTSIKEQVKALYNSLFNNEGEVVDTPEAVEQVETQAQTVETVEEPEAVETVAEAAQEAEVVDLSTDALKAAITEAMVGFKAEKDAEIETYKTELSAKDEQITALTTEIETLKTELSAQPEAESTTVAPTETAKREIKLNAPATTRARATQNIAAAMGW